MKEYFIYIMSNTSRTLYMGMTNDLARRVSEHKQKSLPGFARRYNTTLLVYYEPTTEALTAIAREKQIKGWTRAKKVSLVESQNPLWIDMSTEGLRQTGEPLLDGKRRDPSLRSG